MIPFFNWSVPSYKPPADPRLEPVDGDEIDELVNWQLQKDDK